MIHDKRLERLYQGLSPKETATLAFTHLARGNHAEADRIRDLVPMKHYCLLDPEHVDHFERLRRATLYYGMERWRYEAHCYAASGFVIHRYHSEDAEVEEQVITCFEAWEVWETRLASLEVAFESVCNKYGLDMADIHHLINANGPPLVLGPGGVDPELVADMTKTFNELLEPPE